MNDTHAVLLLLKQNGRASISAVLNFRKALTFTQKRYPFSFAFGPAYSREACIESAQAVYERLMLGTPSEETVLPFESIALLALNETSEIDQRKAKALVKLFRPDRQGCLTVLDFVKSVDSVYKEFRLLSASIENSSRIDRAFENLFNILFYALVATLILIQLDFDPLALFLSLSSVILAFAFIIGSASAKYFEGLLFILVRRPYGIGDRIHISNVENDTSISGSSGWVSRAGPSRLVFWQDELHHSNLCPLIAHIRLSKMSRCSRRLLFGDQRKRDAVCRTAPWPIVASSTVLALRKPSSKFFSEYPSIRPLKRFAFSRLPSQSI
jgi:hypothetical protein